MVRSLNSVEALVLKCVRLGAPSAWVRYLWNRNHARTC